MEFSRQDYRIGLPFPTPGGLPSPGTETGSLALQADSLPSEPPKYLCKSNSHLKENNFETEKKKKKRTKLMPNLTSLEHPQLTCLL